MKEYINKPFIEYLNLVRSIFIEGQETGLIRKDLTPGVMKRALFGALDEMGRYWILSARKKHSIEEAAQQISDVFIRGVMTEEARKNFSWSEKTQLGVYLLKKEVQGECHCLHETGSGYGDAHKNQTGWIGNRDGRHQVCHESLLRIRRGRVPADQGEIRRPVHPGHHGCLRKRWRLCARGWPWARIVPSI